eukprot:2111230-Pyramimonas_sp.AAC.1
MVDQTAASCSVQWVSCVFDHVFVSSRALEVPDVPAAQFERARLSGIGDCVDQGPQGKVPAEVRPRGVVPGGCMQAGPEGSRPPDGVITV